MISFFRYCKLGVINRLNITFNLRSIIKISYKGLPAQISHWVFINILGLMLGNNANPDEAVSKEKNFSYWKCKYHIYYFCGVLLRDLSLRKREGVTPQHDKEGK